MLNLRSQEAEEGGLRASSSTANSKHRNSTKQQKQQTNKNKNPNQITHTPNRMKKLKPINQPLQKQAQTQTKKPQNLSLLSNFL